MTWRLCGLQRLLLLCGARPERSWGRRQQQPLCSSNLGLRGGSSSERPATGPAALLPSGQQGGSCLPYNNRQQCTLVTV